MQTQPFRAALVLLTDALARQNPADVIGEIRSGGVINDLTDAATPGIRCRYVCQG